MWIADGWKDYEVLDTSGGEKLERWGDYLLVRPDPQVIWNTKKENPGRKIYAARAIVGLRDSGEESNRKQ